jgi:hypothetical protein
MTFRVFERRTDGQQQSTIASEIRRKKKRESMATKRERISLLKVSADRQFDPLYNEYKDRDTFLFSTIFNYGFEAR